MQSRRLTVLAKGADVRTDDTLSIRGNSLKSSEAEVKKWVAETSGKE